jgi:two-component system, OmpR family, sensor histidine kinase VicK
MSPRTGLSRLWPRRLHQQLIAMVSGLLVLALAWLGGYTAYDQAAEARRAAEAQAATLARNVAVASSALILTDSLDGLEELVLRSVEVGDTRSILVTGRKGEVAARVARGESEAPKVIYDTRLPEGVKPPAIGEGGPLPWTHADDDIIEAWHPVLAGALIGWVRVEADTATLREQRARVWRNTLVVAVLAVLVCMGLLTTFLRSPMRLLANAGRFARGIVDAQGHQMPYQYGPQEIEELRVSLNEASMLMCQQMIMLENNLGELKAHEAQLAMQNDQLGAIFRLSQDGLVTFDRALRVRFVNQAFLAHTGLSEAEVADLPFEVLSNRLQALSAPDKPFEGLSAVFAGGEGVLPVLTLELAGERRKILSLSGQCSAQGGVSRVLYVCDVTRQHLLDEMKSEFLSMAAHELRTPMVSIFGFTELMMHRPMNDTQRQDLLGRIHRQSQAMMGIINELLDLARIEARKGRDLQIEEVDLIAQVRPVLGDHRPPSGREPPAVEYPDLPMPVKADPQKLKQAVLNVLSNAYKYSPGGGEVRVSFVSADEAALAEGPQRFGVRISDQGIGMSPDQVARMGERFFRADKSGNIPGTGLGLSIVKELLDLMGGRMQVRSELGRGTEVTLWW